jgi:hypothetical protein
MGTSNNFTLQPVPSPFIRLPQAVCAIYNELPAAVSFRLCREEGWNMMQPSLLLDPSCFKTATPDKWTPEQYLYTWKWKFTSFPWQCHKESRFYQFKFWHGGHIQGHQEPNQIINWFQECEPHSNTEISVAPQWSLEASVAVKTKFFLCLLN